MGSRASETLKEIEELRGGLDTKIAELEGRMPPLAKLGRRAVGMALGGGAGSAALLWGVRRLRSKKEPEQVMSALAAPYQVNVLPKGLLPVAVVAVAVWAGVRIYEAKLRAADQADAGFQPAVVKPMPEGGRSAAGN